MANRPDISILGAGRVGTAIGVLAARAGWTVRAVWSRSPARARAAARRMAQEAARAGAQVRAMPAAEAASAAGLVLLTVPDDAIAPLCRELAAARAFRRGAVVAHCSGALGSEALQPAKACGCRVGSMHPLQTFPTAEAAIAALPGAYCYIEGDGAAVAALRRLARAIGGHPAAISAKAKTLYHAAAAMASNHLAAVLDAALRIGEAAGLDRRRMGRAMAPLVRATVDNVLAAGPERALTGPVARGDVQTVRRHLAALGGGPSDLAALYAALADYTVALALRKGSINPQTARRLRACLRAGAAPRQARRKEKP